MSYCIRKRGYQVRHPPPASECFPCSDVDLETALKPQCLQQEHRLLWRHRALPGRPLPRTVQNLVLPPTCFIPVHSRAGTSAPHQNRPLLWHTPCSLAAVPRQSRTVPDTRDYGPDKEQSGKKQSDSSISQDGVMESWIISMPRALTHGKPTALPPCVRQSFWTSNAPMLQCSNACMWSIGPEFKYFTQSASSQHTSAS